MKHLLLTFSITLLALALQAQDTIWWGDFSGGLSEWEVNTLRCGENTGPNLGTYTLTSITIAGDNFPAVDGTTFQYSFLNENEYSVKFSNEDNSVNGTVYSFYSVDNDTLLSFIDTSMVVASGIAFEETTANGIVNWATNFEVPADERDQWLLSIGATKPRMIYSNGGDNLILSASQGLFVMNFERTSMCGENWVWSPNGNYGYNLFGGALTAGSTIQSETEANGSVQLNAVYQSSLGDTGYSPGQPPYPQYVAEIVSSPIDITAADRTLEVQISQGVGFLNTPTDAPTDAGGNRLKTSFSISNDGGATWSSAIDVNPNLATNTISRNTVTLPIPSAYVGGASEIQIKFTYASDFYFWALDDIIIRERGAADMQVNQNFYAIAPNAITPVSQVESFGFLADIQNNGGENADEVNLNVTVNNLTAGTEIYNTDFGYDTVEPDVLAENYLFPDELDGSTLTVGSYMGQYTVSHSVEEVNTSNDVLDFEFTVGDTLFSKELGSTRSVTPAGDGNNSYYYGNAFYTPKGEGWYARHMSFIVTNADEIEASGAGNITTYLYQWEGDTNGDGEANPDEYGGAPIAFNSYTFTGNEGSNEVITIPVDLEGNGVALFDNYHYIAMIQYVAVADEDFFLGASEDFDYSAMFFRSDSLEATRYAALLEVSDASNPDFSALGFGRDIVPVIRLSIGNNPDLTGDAIVSADDILPANYGMSVFPNPATTKFTIELDMPEMVSQATLQLFNASGQVIWQEGYTDLLQARFEYDVTTLPAGMYFARLSTEAGSRTERIIINR